MTNNFAKRLVAAFVVASALTFSLVAPASADEGNAQERVCNHTGLSQLVYIMGDNQYHQTVRSSSFLVDNGSCTTLYGWWWRVGSWTTNYWNNGASYNSTYVYGPDGGISTASIP